MISRCRKQACMIQKLQKSVQKILIYYLNRFQGSIKILRKARSFRLERVFKLIPAVLVKQRTQLARFYRRLTSRLENPKKCFCQGSLSFRTILHEVAYSTISPGRTYPQLHMTYDISYDTVTYGIYKILNEIDILDSRSYHSRHAWYHKSSCSFRNAYH